jgi:hypothetical protein
LSNGETVRGTPSAHRLGAKSPKKDGLKFVLTHERWQEVLGQRPELESGKWENAEDQLLQKAE